MTPLPSVHRQRELLLSLARTLKAGLPLTRALELAAGEAAGDPTVAGLLAARDRLDRGEPLDACHPELSTVFDAVVVTLLEAGHLGGTLDACLESAAAHLQAKIDLRRSMMLALAYPGLMALAGLVLLPIPTLYSDGVMAAVLRYYLPIACLLGATYGLFRVVTRRIETGPGRLQAEAFAAKVPLVGPLVRAKGQALFFGTLAELLAAGLPLAKACQRAAASSGSAGLTTALPALIRQLDAGEPLSVALSAFPQVSSGAKRTLAAGEESGTVPGVCKLIAQEAREEISRRGTQLAVALGVAAVAAVALTLVWQIVGFWSEYFEKIGELSN